MKVCHQDRLFYPSSDEWPLQTHGASPPRNNRFSSLLGCWVFANQDQSGVSTFPAKTSLLKLRHRVVQVRLRALPRNSSNWLWYELTHTHNTRFDGGGAGSQETGAHFLMFFFSHFVSLIICVVQVLGDDTSNEGLKGWRGLVRHRSNFAGELPHIGTARVAFCLFTGICTTPTMVKKI